MPEQASEFHRLLQQQRHAPVDFPMRATELSSVADAFLEFLTLPDSLKRQLHFAARSHRASADGYTDKSAIDHKDPKQFFHWSPMLLQKPITERLQASQPQVARFMEAAAGVYAQIEKVLFAVFSRHLPNYVEPVFQQQQLRDGILRFVCYAPRPQHSFCARAHFDKGFSTLALADSAPGLRIGCCDAHPLKAVSYTSGTALFMPAWMLFQASNGGIKPAWHDVIHAPKQQNVNPFCARWSMVFFVNSPGATFSSWQQLHTPLH